MSSLGNKVEVHGPCASIDYDSMAEDYAICLRYALFQYYNVRPFIFFASHLPILNGVRF
jgi:hypothetical protein